MSSGRAVSGSCPLHEPKQRRRSTTRQGMEVAGPVGSAGGRESGEKRCGLPTFIVPTRPPAGKQIGISRRKSRNRHRLDRPRRLRGRCVGRNRYDRIPRSRHAQDTGFISGGCREVKPTIPGGFRYRCTHPTSLFSAIADANLWRFTTIELGERMQWRVIHLRHKRKTPHFACRRSYEIEYGAALRVIQSQIADCVVCQNR